MYMRHVLCAAFPLVVLLAVAGASRGAAHAEGASPVTASGADRGVRVAFQAPPGPYFLGELLPITATITNRSGAAVTVAGPPTTSGCAGTWVVASGGSPPSYVLPLLPISCPGSGGESLAQGQSLVGRFVVPLTMSGGVTLALRDTLARDGRGRPFFAGRTPRVPIRVLPVVPSDRVLRLIPAGRALAVTVAGGPVPPLLVIHQVVWANHAGFSSSVTWRAIAGTRIGAPPSLIAGKHETWTVLVGAAGYRIAIGTYSRVPL